jgi:glycine betaine transporter
MVWWLAWAPFVGVFIARISRGRTIREFLAGVLLVPTVFSILWFGVFGGIGFFEGAAGNLDPTIVQTNINQTSFLLLDTLPLSFLTVSVTIVAAFLFIVTSVVSAAFVLSMFSTGGNSNPSVRIKLIWGVILGALGLVMILSKSVEAVRQIIALSASPFVFIVLFLMVCLLKALKKEKV